jgi:hypothetical protein
VFNEIPCNDIARTMELKTARLTLLIDPNKKVAFERLCARQDRTASQVVRQLIRDYLTEHGVDDVVSGVNAPPEVSAGTKQPAPPPRTTARAGGQPGRQSGWQESTPATRSSASRR